MNNALKRHTEFTFFRPFRKWPIYFFSLQIFLIIAGCNKENQAPQLTANYDIYMAGTMEYKAVYWKNGVPATLNDSGIVKSIIVIGRDIYACGAVNKLRAPFATYWKNGKEIPLEKQNQSAALGMAVQGNDIYCVGNISGPDGELNAVCWKNGIANYLPLGSKSSANGITVIGDQVYISGETYGHYTDSAFVWKNNQKVFFGANGSMEAAGFNGIDTFFIGELNSSPTTWVNNKITKLFNNGFVVTMTFSGTDKYFGGGVRPNLNDNYAAIWKNDSLTILTDQYTHSAVLGLTFAGTDLYAVGNASDEFIGVSPVYWKNGVMVKLGSNGQVTSIAISH